MTMSIMRCNSCNSDRMEWVEYTEYTGVYAPDGYQERRHQACYRCESCGSFDDYYESKELVEA